MNAANLTIGVRVVVGKRDLSAAMWRIKAVGFFAALLGVPLDVETARPRASVTRLDGEPLQRGPDGLIHGDPLNLTDEQRARMPKLEPLRDGPDEYALGVSNLPEE